jgi:DNA-binding beta-propeller fold protein YncE
MNAPAALTVGPGGNLYVADFGANAVRVFDTLHGMHGYAALPTITNAALDNPCGLAIDGAGKLYVTNDNGASIVPIFDTLHGNAPLPPITGNG